ncbi:MAG: hypothetical protein WC737_00890 [Parcubacteria group bacterium]
MKFAPRYKGLVCEHCKKIFTVLREYPVDGKWANLCKGCVEKEENPFRRFWRWIKKKFF